MPKTKIENKFAEAIVLNSQQVKELKDDLWKVVDAPDPIAQLLLSGILDLIATIEHQNEHYIKTFKCWYCKKYFPINEVVLADRKMWIYDCIACNNKMAEYGDDL
jgi:hypothetical protein